VAVLGLAACVDLSRPDNVQTSTGVAQDGARPMDAGRADERTAPSDGPPASQPDASVDLPPGAPDGRVVADAPPPSMEAPPSPVDAPPDASRPPPDVAATVGLARGLVGYWKLDEDDQQSIAVDSSGSGNTGTYGDVLGASLVPPVMFADPRSRFFVKANRSRVEVPDAPSLTLGGPFTVAAWIRTTVAGTDNQVIAQKADSVGGALRSGYSFRLDGAQKLKLLIFDGGTAIAAVTAQTALPLDTWVHVAGVRDGAMVRIFVNGTMAEFLTSPVFPADGASPLYLGHEGGGRANGFDGNLDEIRLYDRALSDAEIMMLAKGGS